MTPGDLYMDKVVNVKNQTQEIETFLEYELFTDFLKKVKDTFTVVTSLNIL